MWKMKVVALLCALVVAATSTPLDDYVNRPDSNYRWSDTGKTVSGKGWKGYILNMTSQASHGQRLAL